MRERQKDEKVKKERDRIGECRSEEENEGEEGRDRDRQINGGEGGSSDRVWVLRRSGAMCSVSSSDLSFLDPPPSRYSGGSLERGRRVKERKIEREGEGVHVHTPRVPTRPYIHVRSFSRRITSRKRNQKGRQINEKERVACKRGREKERERQRRRGERNLFDGLWPR